MTKYMLDTVIFNRLVDGCISLEHLPLDGRLVATDIQNLELKNTKDEQRRAKLLTKFDELTADLESNALLWGAMTWGRMHWQSEKANQIFICLQARRDSPSYRKRKAGSDEKDSLIAESALMHGCILLTCDPDLAEIVNQIAPGMAVLITTQGVICPLTRQPRYSGPVSR